MPSTASLALLETRRVRLPEQRKRRLLSPVPAMHEWVRVVQLWIVLAGAITAIVYLLDLPGSLELRGWVAAAFVWLPGPSIATGAAAVRALALRNPETRALRERIEQVHRHAALALRGELAATDGHHVLVDEYDLEVRRAWVLGGGDGGPHTAWVLVGDTHALVIGGALPSTHIFEDDDVIPRRWIVERLPETRRLLSLRATGSSVVLERAAANLDFCRGRCEVFTLETLPHAIARATIGVDRPYR